jgi:hypothetical protein
MSGDVVGIHSRTAYRADFRGLASGRVRAAREKLGLDHDGFAAYLGGLLGWTVMPGTIARWEDGHGVPPGDVLLAAAAAGGEAPASWASLLDSVPDSFPAATLEGPWVTCYQFDHEGVPQCHADIAHVTAGRGHHVTAVNHPPVPRTEGRASPFRNEIAGQLAGRHLAGHWRNTSDTRYFGSLHLAVLPGETVMDGWYTGLASDIAVSAGRWKWVRLDPASLPGDLDAVRLRDPAALCGLVMGWSQYGAPMALDDVREDT